MKKMKTFISVFALTIIFTGSGCKKGEKDPFFSFKSRTNRLKGDWELTQIDVKTTTVNDNENTTSTITYDGTTYKSVTTGTSYGLPVSNTYESNYSQVLTIDKNGTYKLVTTDKAKNNNPNGNIFTTEESGHWAFVRKNKNADLKNKEAIYFSRENITYKNSSPSSTTSTTTEGDYLFGTYERYTVTLDKLSSKEMVVKISSTNVTNPTFNGKTTQTTEGTYTFSKK